ncbi:hypothetical protein D3C87_968380 [compost metagenome]
MIPGEAGDQFECHGLAGEGRTGQQGRARHGDLPGAHVIFGILPEEGGEVAAEQRSVFSGGRGGVSDAQALFEHPEVTMKGLFSRGDQAEEPRELGAVLGRLRGDRAHGARRLDVHRGLEVMPPGAPGLDWREGAKGHERLSRDPEAVERDDVSGGDRRGMHHGQGLLVLPGMDGDQLDVVRREALGGERGAELEFGVLAHEEVERAHGIQRMHVAGMTADGHQGQFRRGLPLGGVAHDLLGTHPHLDLGAGVQGMPVDDPLLKKCQRAEPGIRCLLCCDPVERVRGSRRAATQMRFAARGAREGEGIVRDAVAKLLVEAIPARAGLVIEAPRPDERQELAGMGQVAACASGVKRHGARELQAVERMPVADRDG